MKGSWESFIKEHLVYATHSTKIKWGQMSNKIDMIVALFT